MRSPERRAVHRLLASLRVLPVTDAIAHRTGAYQRSYRRSHGAIGVPDYLIAGTAALHGLSLATLNVHHVPMFDGLEPPFRLG